MGKIKQIILIKTQGVQIIMLYNNNQRQGFLSISPLCGMTVPVFSVPVEFPRLVSKVAATKKPFYRQGR